MIVSHRHRFVFLHVNRTGGTSVARTLMDRLGPDDEIYGYEGLPGRPEALVREQDLAGLHKHAKLRDLARTGALERWDGYLRFCFARDPWDRMLSAYGWWQQLARPHQGWDLNDAASQIKEMSFTEYLRSPLGLPQETPASEFAFDGGRSVDFVGRFETLERDFGHVCEKLGLRDVSLRHLNATERGDYRRHYDDDLAERVARHFAADIEAFGYRFG